MMLKGHLEGLNAVAHVGFDARLSEAALEIEPLAGLSVAQRLGSHFTPSRRELEMEKGPIGLFVGLAGADFCPEHSDGSKTQS
ncbi:hypothetical protein RZS28_15610 [Methylocapsa polymorpha]|uniref:Uncharacterized protein n=1 Tax=Methylocapsa polymorpha TaxID=3080828 RepID=A0ABZ0HPK1_9HYPH|nr:hypothetical protein RZS28_15610 [Methylocapsa sp. RX1]